MDDMAAGPCSSAYASNRYRALQQFFGWLAAEDELPDPMEGLQPPRVTDKLVPVFTRKELTRLEHACAGRSFAQRRDTEAELARLVTRDSMTSYVLMDQAATLDRVAALTGEGPSTSERDGLDHRRDTRNHWHAPAGRRISETPASCPGRADQAGTAS